MYKFCVGLLVSLAAFFYVPSASAERVSYILGTASLGGTYYPVGVALSTMTKIKLRKSGISLSAISSAGSGDNIRLMETGDAHFGIVQGLYGYYADSGEGPYTRYKKDSNGNIISKQKNPKPFLRSVTGLWKNVEHFVVQKDHAPNRTLSEFSRAIKDPYFKFGIGKANSGTEGSGLYILGSLGIEFSDSDGKISQFYRAGYSSSASALQDGKIQGMNTPAGSPVSAVSSAFKGRSDLTILEFSDQELRRINAATPSPIWTRYILKAGTYSGLNEDTKTIAQSNFLGVHKNINEKHVYLITKGIFDNLYFLSGIHKATSGIKLFAVSGNGGEDKSKASPSWDGLSVPLHKGAYRYYMDQGLSVPASLMPPEVRSNSGSSSKKTNFSSW